MSQTVAIIFVKAAGKKLKELNTILCDPKWRREARLAGISVYACSGHFDLVLIAKFKSAKETGEFVVEKLRTELGTLISDTQTFICWELG